MNSRGLFKKVFLTWMAFVLLFFSMLAYKGGEKAWDHPEYLLLFILLMIPAACLPHQFEIMRAWSLSRQRKGNAPIVRPYITIDVSATGEELMRSLRAIAESRASFKQFEAGREDVIAFKTKMSWRSFGERAVMVVEPHGRGGLKLYMATMPVLEHTLHDGGRSLQLMKEIIAELESTFAGKISVGEIKPLADAEDASPIS